jgi:predicted nucleic acid-binding protein
VLIATFQADHPHHQPSLQRFLECNPETGCCGGHTLAEVYATLTRMPPKQRISPSQAILLVNTIRERLTTIALTSEEDVAALQFAADLGIIGGNVYDAMLAQCALKSGAEIIYTWNTKHYARCGPEVTRRLRTP